MCNLHTHAKNCKNFPSNQTELTFHPLNNFHLLLFFSPLIAQIGICGKSGSGKSSLANSLFGVIEIVSGQILIDDIDISRVRLIELRSRLSIIPQEDGILFCSTVRENLDPHNRFSDMKLWECLERVQLKGLISSLPDKLGTKYLD